MDKILFDVRGWLTIMKLKIGEELLTTRKGNEGWALRTKEYITNPICLPNKKLLEINYKER